MTPPTDPPIGPMPDSAVWVTSGPEPLIDHFDESLLVVRLGMAHNALLSQHRLTQALGDETGAAHMRDLVGSLVTAAALTHETLVLIHGNYPLVIALAREGQASDELLTHVGELLSGTDPACAVMAKLRNKIGFHWDAEHVGESLKAFATHQSFVWMEGKDTTNGETVFRLSLDVLTNALWPAPTAEGVGMSDLVQQTAVRSENARTGTIAMARAMGIASNFIYYVTRGFFARIRPQVHHRPDKSGA